MRVRLPLRARQWVARRVMYSLDMELLPRDLRRRAAQLALRHDFQRWRQWTR